MDERPINPNWRSFAKSPWAFELGLEEEVVLPKRDSGVGGRRGRDILARKARTGEGPRGQRPLAQKVQATASGWLWLAHRMCADWWWATKLEKWRPRGEGPREQHEQLPFVKAQQGGSWCASFPLRPVTCHGGSAGVSLGPQQQISRQLITNAGSWVHPRPTESIAPGVGPSTALTSPPGDSDVL